MRGSNYDISVLLSILNSILGLTGSQIQRLSQSFVVKEHFRWETRKKLWNSEWNAKPSFFKSEWIFIFLHFSKSTGFESEPNMEMDSKESKKREKRRRNGTYPIKTILHEYILLEESWRFDRKWRHFRS